MPMVKLKLKEPSELLGEITKLHVEIERLQAAKRRALQVADERSKENVALRALGKRAADTIRTLDPFGDHWSEHDLRVLAGEK